MTILPQLVIDTLQSCWHLVVLIVSAALCIMVTLHVLEGIALRVTGTFDRRRRLGRPFKPATSFSSNPVLAKGVGPGSRSPAPATIIEQPVVLVTGGAMGIGRELVLRYGRLGYRVIVWDILPDVELKIVKDEIVASIANPVAVIEFHRVDVSDLGEVTTAAATLLSPRDGGVSIIPDLVILNAGIVSGKSLIDDVPAQSKLPRMLKVIDVNVKQLLLVAGTLVPAMVLAGTSEEVQVGHARHRGIVVMGSVAGFVGTARMTDYNSSKAAANIFAEALSAELAELSTGNVGIHVTLVCPYLVSTGMFQGTKRVLGIPDLKPGRVADAIVRGVRLKKRVVVLPHVMLWWLAVKALVPWSMVPLIDNFAGGSRAMATFTGRDPSFPTPLHKQKAGNSPLGTEANPTLRAAPLFSPPTKPNDAPAELARQISTVSDATSSEVSSITATAAATAKPKAE
jgi:all-trans-retinol dehydrogenase (NAD+)